MVIWEPKHWCEVKETKIQYPLPTYIEIKPSKFENEIILKGFSYHYKLGEKNEFKSPYSNICFLGCNKIK